MTDRLAFALMFGGLAFALAVVACCLFGAALGRVGIPLEARRPPLTPGQLEHGGRFHDGGEV